MSKPLLIVESPAKARTIGRYLKGKFIVKASVGHIRDLPVKDLGVDIDNDFAPQYVTIRGKGKIITELKAAAKGVTDVYLAPDPDREGEAIAWHIATALGNGRKKYHRVLFNELTKEAILEAVANPGRLDRRKFESQQARRILDRLVGYLISPLLWDKVKRGLSAGRVQSVAVRVIVEREREIWAFRSKEYWSVTASLSADEPPVFPAKVTHIGGKKLGPHDIENEEAAKTIAEDLDKAEFIVKDLQKKQRRRQPAPPFITSTLQQDAARKLGFTAKRTMSVAQRLYEGIDLGKEGAEGLITYMRTDSVRLSPAAVGDARKYINGKFGGDYLPDKPRTYRTAKGAQDAHEAIRPTSLSRPPESLTRFLEKDELNLYRLVWNRFLASQMNPAVFDQTAADIGAGGAEGAGGADKYTLRATGQVLRFDGFMRAYVEGLDNGVNGTPLSGREDDQRLPELSVGQNLEKEKIEPRQHFTQPPPRFTEATLIRELEEKGIGRPSTYAAILSTIQDKGYVDRVKKRFVPTEMGLGVNDLLVQNFPDILNVTFTARMESDLDKVEDGDVDWLTVLNKFYGPFVKDLDTAKEAMRLVKAEGLPTALECQSCGKPMAIKFGRSGPFLACSGYPECKNTSNFTRDDDGNVVPVARNNGQVIETDIECDKCGKTMVVKSGRRGEFLACPGYPECRNTSDFTRDEDGKIVKATAAAAGEAEGAEEVCPNCEKPMAVRRGRFGPFLACSGYPECKTTKKIVGGKQVSAPKGPPAEPLIPCPEKGCEGGIIPKKTRKGKTFYSCNRYPKCKWATWNRPVDQKCPDCGAPYIVEKRDKQKKDWLMCENGDCGYQVERSQE